MRLSLVILGVVVILGGAFGYYVTVPSWKVWIFFLPFNVPNPFSIFRPLVWLALALGIVLFLLGIFMKGEEK